TAPAHGLGLVHERDHTAGIGSIALRIVRAVIHHDKHVDGGDLAFLREADLHAPVEAGTGPADVMLFFAADPHHHRRADLLRHDRRDNGRNGAGDLAPEAAAGIFADDHNRGGIDL